LRPLQARLIVVYPPVIWQRAMEQVVDNSQDDSFYIGEDSGFLFGGGDDVEPVVESHDGPHSAADSRERLDSLLNSSATRPLMSMCWLQKWASAKVLIENGESVHVCDDVSDINHYILPGIAKGQNMRF
jgi:hypothetical protein